MGAWTTLGIILFEIITFKLVMDDVPFITFLVATAFSEDNRTDTVSFCIFRRMENLIFLCMVSFAVLFNDTYNDDSLSECYKFDNIGCNEANWNEYYDDASWPGFDECTTSVLESKAMAVCRYTMDYVGRYAQNDTDIELYEDCDCELLGEVLMTKGALLLAWCLSSLCSAVFFGTSIRQFH